jgi:hypothetical protein
MPNLEDRLREVMQANKWEHDDVVRISGQTSSVVSQWLGKGSKEIKRIARVSAAVSLAQASGYSATWIAEGTGPRRMPSSAVNLHVNEPKASYGSADLLDQLEQTLQQLPHDKREAVALLLAGWAREGGAAHYKSAVKPLLSTEAVPRKRSAAG